MRAARQFAPDISPIAESAYETSIHNGVLWGVPNLVYAAWADTRRLLSSTKPTNRVLPWCDGNTISTLLWSVSAQSSPIFCVG